MTTTARLAALATLLAVSGCLGDATEEAEAADVPPEVAAAPDAAATKVAPLRNAQSESFLAQSPDGQVVLTCTHGEFKEPSLMFASTDAGATWRELAAFPPPPPGGDCEVAVTADGAWHFLHTHAYGVTLATTTDEGATWRVDSTVAPPVNTFSDRPWLEAAGASLVLTYSGYLGIAARTSHDGGATWSLPQLAVPSRTGYLTLSGHLEVLPDASLAVQPFLEFAATAGGEAPSLVHLGVGVSEDGGASWQKRGLAEPVEAIAFHPAVAVLPDGTLHLSYYAVNGSAYDFRVATSRDAGLSWDEPRTLASALAGVGRAWAAAAPDGGHGFLVQADGAGFGLAGEDADRPVLAYLRVAPDGTAAPPVRIAAVRDEFASLLYAPDGTARVTYTETGGSLTQAPSDGQALWFVRLG